MGPLRAHKGIWKTAITIPRFHTQRERIGYNAVGPHSGCASPTLAAVAEKSCTPASPLSHSPGLVMRCGPTSGQAHSDLGPPGYHFLMKSGEPERTDSGSPPKAPLQGLVGIPHQITSQRLQLPTRGRSAATSSSVSIRGDNVSCRLENYFRRAHPSYMNNPAGIVSPEHLGSDCPCDIAQGQPSVRDA